MVATSIGSEIARKSGWELSEPNLSANALTVLRKRYLQKDADGNVVEKPPELFWRVAQNLARADALYGATEGEVAETAREFYEVMAKLDFLPNSPTLMNAGNDLQQLSACFVLPVEDSLKDIFETLKHQALIHQSGGGTGFAFSRLRPKGDLVRSTMGVASGPVSFMRIFDAATQTVKQGGKRRGANMGILRVDHPDIRDFIHCKTEQGEVTNFNISVAVTDDFMEAYRRDGEYDLVNPRTAEVASRLKAREIMDEIAEAAWRNGEPGLFFVDTTERKNPCPHIAKFEATNPCVTGDTWVTTGSGPQQVADLVNKPTRVLVNGGFHMTTGTGFFETGVRRVLELATDRGYRIRVTPNHLIQTVTGLTRHHLKADWKPAGTLRAGDKIVLSDHRDVESWGGPGNFEEGYLLGLLVGDGTIKRGVSVISVWGKGEGPESVRRAAEKCAQALPHRANFRGFQKEVGGREEFRMKLRTVHDLALQHGLSHRNKGITPQIEKTSSAFHCGFLRGLFDADGSVQGWQDKGISVRLSQSDLAILRGVQRMLHRLGIASTIYEYIRSEGARALPDGKGGRREYQVRSQHELVISGSNIAVFAGRVGFGDEDKGKSLIQKMRAYRRKMNRERFVAEITSIENGGREKVFDVQIPGVNAFDANGVFVHNCGEQPLLPYESCNLGSINLERHLEKKDGRWELDWAKLEKTVRLCVHLLDNVIDMNAYPVPQIEEMTKKTRKIGLGVMGFARMLFRLGVPYDSEEGVAMGRKVMKFIHDTGWDESQKLAEARGVYPAWERGSMHEKMGLRMRNSYVTTVAPTGTLSMIADTSGGCEPEFSLVWYKNVMDGEHLPYVLEMFIQVAKESGFWSEDLLKKIVANHGGVRGLEEVPEEWQRIFAVSHDVSPAWHVRMQAAFQEFTDSAVSKTINLPSDATVDDVKEAYLLAYELGCKGITVYRDGSRPGQVMNIGVSKDTGAVEEERAELVLVRPRPDVAVGRTQKIKTPYGSLYVTVNEDDHGLFEVFAQIGRGGGYTASFTEAVARLISLCLRSRVPVEQIIKQLDGIRSPRIAWDHQERIYSIPDALAKALKRHVSGGLQTTLQPRVESFEEEDLVSADVEKEKEIRDDLEALVRQGHNPECPECGSMLIFEEGCVKCHACGFSEC